MTKSEIRVQSEAQMTIDRHVTFRHSNWVRISGFIVLIFSFVAHAGDLAVLKSKHYTIHTDLDRPLAQDMARRLDAMHAEYERRLADFVDESQQPPMQVYLFAHKADYDRLTDNKHPNTGGLFMAGQRELLAAFLEGQGRDALRRTLQHEAFHQFAYTHISKDLPTWINEGLAQIFEEGIWMGDGFVVGQVPPRRLRQLQADIKAGRLIDFRTFVSFSDDDWKSLLAGAADHGASQYNQAWAMTHFLVYSKPVFRQRMLKMLQSLHNGAASEKAFEQAFSANYEGFQKLFLEWVGSVTASPEASQVESQQVLADILIALQKQGRQFDSIESFQEMLRKTTLRLNYTRGNLSWSIGDVQSYFRDSAGRVLGPNELFFANNQGHPLPDLVRRYANTKVRTIFHQRDGGVEHETVFE